MVEGLKVAAKGEVEEECGGAVVQCAEETDRADENVAVDGKTQHDGRGADNDEDESERETGGEKQAVQKPAVGFVETAGAVRLGEECVEAEEDSGDAERDGVV